MKTIKSAFLLLGLAGLAQWFPWPALDAQAADPNPILPPAVEKGFKLLGSANPTVAFDAWREAAVLDDATKAAQDRKKFEEIVKPLRNYRSYEIIEVREIGRTSKLLCVSISFERGILYGSFLVWKSERDWLVQHADFATKPEVIMPWLALSPGR